MQEVTKPKKVLRDLDKIEVKKSELLARCKEHLVRHTKELKEARTKWRKDAIQMMRRNITKISVGGPRVYDTYRGGLEYPNSAPNDRTEQFREMIAKLEASNAEFVLLKPYAFSLYWEGKTNRH